MEYTLRFLFNFLSEIAISNVCKLKLFKNLTGCVIFIQLQKILLSKFSVELEFIHDDLYHLLLMNTLDFRPPSSKVANNGRYYQNYQSFKVILREVVSVKGRQPRFNLNAHEISESQLLKIVSVYHSCVNWGTTFLLKVKIIILCLF